MESHEQFRQSAYHALPTVKALQRFRDRGKRSIGSIIDIGASDGSWSVTSRGVFPEARCHLLEANPQWEPDLRNAVAWYPGFSYSLAAAGAERGTTRLYLNPEDRHSATTVAGTYNESFEAPQVSVDDEVYERALPPPFLIKFDTHGAEREILEGCKNVLRDTSLIVMEMYLFQDKAHRFPAMCLHLETLGFRCIDFAEPLYRSHDFALWQFDALFIPDTSPEFTHLSFY